MKKKRLSVEQIVSVLKQAESGLPVSDLIRHVGVVMLIDVNLDPG
jgi:putative transposase